MKVTISSASATIAVGLAAVILVSTLVPAPSPAATPRTRFATSSFEPGLQGWRRDHFGESELRWRITPSRDRAFHGMFSLKVSSSGAGGGEAVWLEERFSAPPGSTISAVVSFWRWGGRGSREEAKALAYLGTSNPERRTEFIPVPPAGRRRGWVRYDYRTPLKVGPTGHVWVAFGFEPPPRGTVTDYLDYTVVRLRRQPS